jgi:drug/metabolite transporter (DMT)-like permease
LRRNEKEKRCINMKSENVGFLQIIIASFLFGIIPIFVRYSENFGVYNLAFYRVFLSALFLGFFFIFTKNKLTRLKYEKKKMLLFGAIHGFIILGYFIAIQTLTIASAVLLLYSSSIWIIIFSYFILKERITSKTYIALIISIIGVFLVLSPENLFIKESLIGSLSGLLAGIGFGLVYVLSKTFKKYDKLSLTFWQNLIAIPFIIPLIFIEKPVLNTFNSLIVITISVITIFAFILVYKGFGKIKGQQGGIVILLDIFVPIILGLIFFSEIPELKTIVGAIFIILGSYIASK